MIPDLDLPVFEVEPMANGADLRVVMRVPRGGRFFRYINNYQSFSDDKIQYLVNVLVRDLVDAHFPYPEKSAA
jgi:hypothetical protein